MGEVSPAPAATLEQIQQSASLTASPPENKYSRSIKLTSVQFLKRTGNKNLLIKLLYPLK